MKNFIKGLSTLILTLMIGSLTLISCEEQTPREKAAEDIEDAAESVGDVFRSESEELKKDIKDVGDDIKDAADDIKNK